MRPSTHPNRHAPVERLAFTFTRPTVAGRDEIAAALAATSKPTFATVIDADPRDWGYGGLMAFTAVLLARPQDQIPGLDALHLAEVFAIVGIGPMLLHRLARQQPVFRVTAETIGLLVLGFAMFVTVPFSIWPGGAMGLFTNIYLKLLVVFVLMMNTLTTPKRVEQVTWLIVLCCGLVSLESVINYARGTNLIEGNRLAGPIGGIFGNPNDLAMNLVTFLPAAGIIAMTKRYSAARRLLAAGIAALMLATIVFTKSRGGALGLGAMVIALVFLGRKVRPGFGAIAVVAVLAALPFVPSSYWERMTSIVDAKKDKQEFTGSRETRWNVMKEGMKVFVERPLTGVGAGQFQNYNPPGRKERWNETHNALIQVAAETGIVGLFALSFLIVRGWLAARATRTMLGSPGRRHHDLLARTMTEEDRRAMYSHSVAMTAALVGWFVCAMFASVAYSWTFYYVLALAVAGRELVRDRQRAARALEPPSTAGARRR